MFFGQHYFVGQKKNYSVKVIETKQTLKMCHQMGMGFDQKSPRPPEEGVSKRHRQTYIQTDIATQRL